MFSVLLFTKLRAGTQLGEQQHTEHGEHCSNGNPSVKVKSEKSERIHLFQKCIYHSMLIRVQR